LQLFLIRHSQIKPWSVKVVGGRKIGFIGALYSQTADISSPGKTVLINANNSAEVNCLSL
jgi:2',3'-cyclic-nucleotide 2'-phosphodiesterase (5'-nucleotidase family)